MTGSLRIIGGAWRSRVVRFREAEGLRPTPSRVRETLFNWLRNDIEGSNCLDLFAGSGALGFEAVSRGAKHAVLVDVNIDTCRELRSNVARLMCDSITIVNLDGFQYIRRATERFNVVFLDPPFGAGFAMIACSQLAASSILATDALIYLETPADLQIPTPERWEVLRHKKAGDVSYRLFRNLANAK